MEKNENRFYRAEQIILQTALLVILVLAIVRFVWPEVVAVKKMIFGGGETEKSLQEASK